MANKFQTTLTVVILVVLGYVFRAPISSLAQRFEHHIMPCHSALTYSIGSFDSRFHLSKNDFVAAMTSAEHIWESGTGRDLFRYVESGGTVTVSLVYDDRQRVTDELQRLGSGIKANQKNYDALEAKYVSLKGSYERDKAAYEASVAYWNAQGGAPRDEYEKLEAQRKSLNDKAAEINATVTVLNRLVDDLQIRVSKYNNVGAEQGGEFNEGEYVSDTRSQRITIYQYDDQSKLVRVLAHEFGHALGLGHVDDTNALMYKINQSTNTRLTSADQAAVTALCGAD